MEIEAVWRQLGDVAHRLGVELRLEPLTVDLESKEPARGGLCLLRGRRVLLVDERASLRDRVATVAHALSLFDLEGIHLPPFVRETIERRGRPPPRGPREGEAKVRVPPPPGSAWVRIGVAVAANDGNFR